MTAEELKCAPIVPKGAVAYSCKLGSFPHRILRTNQQHAGQSTGKRTAATGENRQLFVNPSLQLAPEDFLLPAGVKARVIPRPPHHIMLCNNDFAGPPTAWVEIPGSRLFLPYVVPAHWLTALQSLEPGLAVPDAVLRDEQLLEALSEAYIVLSAERIKGEEDAWTARREQAVRDFKTHGYCLIKQLVPPNQLAALSVHCDKLLAYRRTQSGMIDAREGYVYRWCEPVASLLNHQLTPLIEQIVGETLISGKPITLWYKADSMLVCHMDGGKFAYSLSLTISEARGSFHPLGLSVVAQDADGAPVRELSANIGDGVLFAGQQMPHFRDRQQNWSHVSMSFSFSRP